MKIEEVSKRIDDLIELALSVLGTSQKSDFGNYVSYEIFSEFRSASLSFLSYTFGNNHPYFKEFDEKINNTEQYKTEQGLGILKAARKEINGGWIFTTRGLISAEIFSDFLEMTSYLLDKGYKDPAAVMLGSILEEHLRLLCKRNNIPITINKDGKDIPKKADALNSDLSATNVYNKLDQKSITSWLDLRNKAAHGLYNEYTKEQVLLTYQAVTNFLSRVS